MSRGEDRWLDVLGILVALCGQVLRALVIGLAYIRRGGRNKRIDADGLVIEGIFAHSRNPLYLGNILALIGFCLIHGSALCYLVGVPFFILAYVAIVLAEEEFLRRRFGAAYDAYAARVHRFLPSFKGLGATLAGLSFDWRRVIRKEYGSTFAGATLVLVLLGWDAVRLDGLPAARQTLVALGIAWVPFVVGYVIARVAKKRGLLGSG